MSQTEGTKLLRALNSCAQSSRGMADRDDDRGRDIAHLRCRAAPVWRRAVDRHRQMGGGPQPGLPGRPHASRVRLACRARPVLGAGTLHLHVHLDGEIRRGLRGAHRHPCRRRRPGQHPSRRIAPPRHHVRPDVRRPFHGHRMLFRSRVRRPDVADRPAIQRFGSADVAGVSHHPARLRADVLPLPAGRVDVLSHRRVAASRHGRRRGRRGRSGSSGPGHAQSGRPRRTQPARLGPDVVAGPDRRGVLRRIRRT